MLVLISFQLIAPPNLQQSLLFTMFLDAEEFSSVLVSVTNAPFFPCDVQTPPSVPRKLKAQWNMGVIQAKEALSMSLDERMANFAFLYDDNGPHLNPHILEKLKPEPSKETAQETLSRLNPELPFLLADDPTATPQSTDSTSSGKEAAAEEEEKAPRKRRQKVVWQRRGKNHLNGVLSIKKLNTLSAELMLHQQTDPQVPINHKSTSLMHHFVILIQSELALVLQESIFFSQQHFRSLQTIFCCFLHRMPPLSHQAFSLNQ